MGSKEKKLEDKVEETDPTGRFVRFGELLGQGAAKVVYKGIDRDSGIEVAWNQMKLNRSAVNHHKLVAEAELLKKLHHDHIIECYHAWIDEKKSQLVFITECMTSGNLRQFLRKAKAVKLKVIKSWCTQILKGLVYLHACTPPIIHRDIKCDNIFINGNLGQLKIGDLGLATVKRTKDIYSVIGTPEFMAPEFYDEVYGEKVDVWAFGLCVLEMVTLEYPYAECENAAQVFRKVSSGQLPDSMRRVRDADVCQFIELCLRRDARDRPSAAELLVHPFLTNSSPERDGKPVDVEPASGTARGPPIARRSSLTSFAVEGLSVPSEISGSGGGSSDAEKQTNGPDFQAATIFDQPNVFSLFSEPVIVHDGNDSGADEKKVEADEIDVSPKVQVVSAGGVGNIDAMVAGGHVTRASPHGGRRGSESDDDRSTGRRSRSGSGMRTPSDLEDAAIAAANEADVTFKLRIATDHGWKSVLCPFDLDEDTPAKVASEMAAEFGLEPRFEEDVCTQISEAVSTLVGARRTSPNRGTDGLPDADATSEHTGATSDVELASDHAGGSSRGVASAPGSPSSLSSRSASSDGEGADAEAESYRQGIMDLDQQHQTEINRIISTHTRRVQDLKKKHERDLRALHSAYENDMTALRSRQSAHRAEFEMRFSSNPTSAIGGPVVTTSLNASELRSSSASSSR